MLAALVFECQARRVHPRLLVGPGLLFLVAACTPPIDPPWLVTGPRELAMEIEVVAQGPHGARIQPGPRSFRDALPLDTLSLRPIVVDADGPVDASTLDGRWVSCSGIGACLLRGPVSDLPACTGDEIQPREPCRFGDGGEGTLTIADVPAELPDDLPTVLGLVNGPTVAFIASVPDGPGLASCMARFDAREPLDGCLMMERVLGIGPLGDLVRVLEELGIDSGIEGEAETLLVRPRNRNPRVEQLRVDVGDQTMLVPSGSVVTVPRDEWVTLTVETTEDDLDGYETMVGEQTAMLTDLLYTQWWLDRDVELEEALPGQQWARVRAGAAQGPVRAYVVLRDDRGGEGWGWLDLELED